MRVMRFIVRIAMISVCLLSVLPVSAQTAAEILDKVDDNEIYKSIIHEGEMIIEYQGRTFVKTFKVWGRENKDSFIEFTNPEDRGTKYLKKDGRLYVYSPDTEQVMLISGHMLKESMMGSDMSYEDTIENERLSRRYTAIFLADERVDGRDCWVLDLAAIKPTESYQKRRLWVAKDNFDMVRAEFYALSGAKLKEYTLIRSELIQGQSFPMESEMRDLLRKNSKTTFRVINLELNAPVSDRIFSTRNLR